MRTERLVHARWGEGPSWYIESASGMNCHASSLELGLVISSSKLSDTSAHGTLVSLQRKQGQSLTVHRDMTMLWKIIMVVSLMQD